MHPDLENKKSKVVTSAGELFVVLSASREPGRDDWVDLYRYRLAKGNSQERDTTVFTDPQVHIKPSSVVANRFDVRMDYLGKRMDITSQQKGCEIRLYDATLNNSEDSHETVFTVASSSELQKWTEAFLDGKIDNRELVIAAKETGITTRAARTRILKSLS